MSDPGKAVFLSYASQDAEAALHLCNALRAAGIEVWFDQTELRGGDTWDASIRRQIKSCALFIPVISKNTHTRGEGYFRLEWKLAVDRSHLMASDLPFLLPVVVDDTPDQEDRVPDRFREVQWTRLSAGANTDAFVDHVRRLLAQDATTPTATSIGSAALPASSTGAPSRRSMPPLSRTFVPWIVGGLLILATCYFVADKFLASKHAVPAAETHVAATVQTEAASDKSIAVLPFVDMSEKKDQEYFSDGLSEELIDHLTQNADLKVIARTSSFAFKGKNEDVRSIATKLGVANLLEGSVRKAGSGLRITAQLIRASDGVHLWSAIYNRKLSDIFKVQDEISTTVAKALNAALNASPAVGIQPASLGTTNIEAYNLLLKGNYYFRRGNKGDDAKAVEYIQKALHFEPQYSLAWAKLARTYAWQGFTGELTAADAEVKVRDAVQRALAIDPNCAEAYYARGNMLRLIVGDWTAAKSDYESAAALDPHGELGRRAQGNTLYLRVQMSGQFDDRLDWARRELERDPLDTDTMVDLAGDQQLSGQLDDSAATFRKLLELNPAFETAQAQYAWTLLLMGKNLEALAAAEQESDDASKLQALACVYWVMGRRAESDSALGALEQGFANRNEYLIAAAHACRGEADAAFAWLDRAYRQRKGTLELFKFDPQFRKLHGDPRFNALLQQAKLVE